MDKPRSVNPPVDFARFPKRFDRTQYALDHFGDCFEGRILDVGCDQAVLRDLLPDGCQYLGIDIGGRPDIQLNLEKIDRLDFEDNRFECVLCTDVLEHLDNLHRVFDELVRVANRYLVLSLPNNWMAARVPIQRGRGHFAHYGLPTERPADRHKWFFSLSEGREFIATQAKRHALEIHAERITEKPKWAPLRLVRRIRWPAPMNYLNRYAHTYWVVLRKNSSGTL